MDEILSEYLEIQKFIEQDVVLGEKLKSLFEDEASAKVVAGDILKHISSKFMMIECWKTINEELLALQGEEVAMNVTLNDNIYYGCLYVMLMMEEDNNDSVESPVFIALNTLLLNAKHLGSDELLKHQCEKVIIAGCERLQNKETPVSHDFLYASLEVIKTQEMSVKLICAYIHCLMPYCNKHYDMVNNLSLADKNSSVGVLAFASLSKLLVKNSEKKQVIFETMLESIVCTMENNSHLSSFEINVKQSNFKQMIRQVGEDLHSSISPLLFAVLRVIERHCNSKSLVSIINQLPFAIFAKFVDILTRLSNKSYSPQLQAFALTMMESPYITEDQDEHKALEKLYFQIADAVVWPLASFDRNAVLHSIRIIITMLQIQNAFIRSILRQMIKCKGVLKDLMTFINQYCDNTWTEQKQFNQYYITVYCRLLILDEQSWKSPQFVQLTSLLHHANANDLLVCLKDVKALTLSATFLQKEVHVPVLNAILDAITPGTESIQYLRFFYAVIFGGLKENRCFYDALTLKTANCDLLIKNLVAHQFITQKDIEILSEHCLNLHCWRLMSDVALFMDLQIPRKLGEFTERLQDTQIRNKVLQEKSILYILQFFASVLNRRQTSFHCGEKENLTRFAVFLEGCLLKRIIPMFATPSAMLTMQKSLQILHLSSLRLVNLFNEVEQITTTAFRTLVSSSPANFDRIQVLERDIYYFSEMQMVFPYQLGTENSSFSCKQQTIDHILNAQTCLKEIRGDFTQIGIAMIYCMTKVAIRNDSLMNGTLSLLYALISREQPSLKECCLHCLYDLALCGTSTFDVLVPYIYDFLVSTNPLNAIAALNMYSKLLSKDHCIPNEWQTFVIAKAVNNKDVQSLLDRETFDDFMQKLRPYFETYFIHILFYANNICDNEEHYLLPEYRSKVVKGKLSLQLRTEIYRNMIKFFRNDHKRKILNYIYKNFDQKYFQLNHDHTLLEDILLITFEALKRKELLDEEMFFEQTSTQIAKFERFTTNKIGNGDDCDEIILIIIRKLVRLLKMLNQQQIIEIQRILHVLFAIIDWNYTGLHNLIADEGSNGKIRKNILRVLVCYRKYSPDFEYLGNSAND